MVLAGLRHRANGAKINRLIFSSSTQIDSVECNILLQRIFYELNQSVC